MVLRPVVLVELRRWANSLLESWKEGIELQRSLSRVSYFQMEVCNGLLQQL